MKKNAAFIEILVGSRRLNRNVHDRRSKEVL